MLREVGTTYSDSDVIRIIVSENVAKLTTERGKVLKDLRKLNGNISQKETKFISKNTSSGQEKRMRTDSGAEFLLIDELLDSALFRISIKPSESSSLDVSEFPANRAANLKALASEQFRARRIVPDECRGDSRSKVKSRSGSENG